jgi:hypothetical protein
MNQRYASIKELKNHYLKLTDTDKWIKQALDKENNMTANRKTMLTKKALRDLDTAVENLSIGVFAWNQLSKIMERENLKKKTVLDDPNDIHLAASFINNIINAKNHTTRKELMPYWHNEAWQ